MGSIKAQVYADELQGCVEATVKMAEGIAAEKRFLQAKEGKAHAAWLVGHLTNTLDTIVLQWVVGGERILPRGWGRKFSPHFIGGDPITTDPANYPAWDEVLDMYKTLGSRCVEGIRALEDADLAGELRGNVPDQFKTFFGNTEKTLQTMVRHDSHHRGQIALLTGLND